MRSTALAVPVLAFVVPLVASACTSPTAPPAGDAGGGGGTDAPIAAVEDGGADLDAPAVPADAPVAATDAPGASDDAPVAALDAPEGSGAAPDAVGPYTVTRSMVTGTGATYVSFVPAVPAGARAPLVLFKHGFQLATSNYAATCERIASHGFVVVGVDTASGLFGGPTNADERDATIAALDWATGAAPFAGAVDATRVAVAGHSRGGKVAVMVAAADTRIDVSLLLDPVNGCGPGTPFSASCPDVTTAAYAGALAHPVGVMGETNNATGGFMPCAPAAQNYQTIYAGLSASPWAVAWTFTGADHMDFTDDGGGLTGSFCTDGPGDDALIRAQVRTLAVAFLRRHLLGEAAMDAWLIGASVPAGITVEGP